MPPTPNDYQPQLPKDFVVPQGLEYKIDTANPIWAQAQDFAHKAGLSQDQFQQMAGLYAGAQIANEQMLKGARDAEIGKLGPAGSARVTAVQGFLNAQLGDELGKVMGTMLVTAKHVEAAEKLLAAFRNQGAGSFSQSHREPNEPAKLSTEQYNKLTYSEQKQYAAQHSNGAARPN